MIGPFLIDSYQALVVNTHPPIQDRLWFVTLRENVYVHIIQMMIYFRDIINVL